MTKGHLAFLAVEAWCKTNGYPVPVPEHPLLASLGRKHLGDICWLDEKIVVEVQGGTWMKKGGHNTGAAIQDDYEKWCLAATLGWRVLPCTYKQFNSGQVYKWLEAIFTEGR